MQQLVPGGGVAAAEAAAAVRQGDGAPHLDEVAVEAGGRAAAAHCRHTVKVCTGRGHHGILGRRFPVGGLLRYRK